MKPPAQGSRRERVAALLNRLWDRQREWRWRMTEEAIAEGTALNRSVIMHAYTRAILVREGFSITPDEDQKFQRQVLKAVVVGLEKDRQEMLAQLKFALPALVQLVADGEKEGWLKPEEIELWNQRLIAATDDTAASHTEFGSMNRAAFHGQAFALMVERFPDLPQARGRWKELRDLLWQEWAVTGDTYEDARGYNALWGFAMLRHAASSSTTEDDTFLQQPLPKRMFARWLDGVTPGGYLPDFGDGHWIHALGFWIGMLDILEGVYQDPRYGEAADRILSYGLEQGATWDFDPEPLAEVVADGRERLPTSQPPNSPKAVVHRRKGEFGKEHWDKLVLQTGSHSNAAYVMVDLFDQGYHGHQDGGAITLYVTDGKIVLHELGREAIAPTLHHTAWAAASVEALVDPIAGVADAVNVWRLDLRRPGTYTGGPTVDPVNLERAFLRLGDPPKAEGSFTAELLRVEAENKEGTREQVGGGDTVSGVRRAERDNERNFLTTPLAKTDFSEVDALWFYWKSSKPELIQYAGVDGAPLHPGHTDRATLRGFNSSPTLGAYADVLEDGSAVGGYVRDMFDQSGRRLLHRRDLLLAPEGQLVVLDTFQSKEPGAYIAGPLWHVAEAKKGEGGSIVVGESIENPKQGQTPWRGTLRFASAQALEVVLKDQGVEAPRRFLVAGAVPLQDQGETATVLSVWSVDPAPTLRVTWEEKAGQYQVKSPKLERQVSLPSLEVPKLQSPFSSRESSRETP